MKDPSSSLRKVASAFTAVAGLVLTASCSKLDSIEQQSSRTQDQVTKTQERLGRLEEKLDQAGASGRYQIIVANEAEKGAVLFLIDTRGGETWIYRPPQGSAINGFWSDIPRLTYTPDFWQRALTQGQGQQPPTNASAPSGVTQPAPATPPLPKR